MNNNIKKVTIITLTFNNWRVLKQAVCSVNRQKVDKKYEIEYLVVDDGTCDLDVDFVTSMLNEGPCNAKLICNYENLGIVKSFNNAIKISSGDIIIPLSADDEFYDENVVQSIIDEFNKIEGKIITAKRVPVRNNIDQKSVPTKKNIELFKFPEKLLIKVASENFISGSSTYYHRDIFNEVGFFDERYRLLEDYPFFLKVLLDERKIHFFDRKVIRYGTDGVTKSKVPNSYLSRDFIRARKASIKRVDLPFFVERKLRYTLFNRYEKLRVLNIIFYMDQFIYFALKKLL